MPFRSEPKLVFHAKPHRHASHSASNILWGTSAVLLLAWLANGTRYGWDTLRIPLISATSLLGFEWGWQVCVANRLMPFGTISNASCFLLAALLTFLMPPTVPWWILVSGALLTVLFLELFGGLGQNIFHPVLASYAVLHHFFGSTLANGLWTANVIAIWAGGIFLLLKRWIAWEIPVLCLASAWIGTVLLNASFTWEILASGSIVLGALFFATDPATSPMTKNGKVVFALLAGFLMALFRKWGHDLESVVYVLLMMNGFVPLLERYRASAPEGHRS